MALEAYKFLAGIKKTEKNVGPGDWVPTEDVDKPEQWQRHAPKEGADYEPVPDADGMQALIRFLLNIILAFIGERLPQAMRPTAAKVARDQAAAEAKEAMAVARNSLPELDSPREIFRIGRRIKLGAAIDKANLTEPVMGALLTMSKPELAKLLVSNHDDVSRWVAVQQGSASPAPDAQPVRQAEPRRDAGMLDVSADLDYVTGRMAY